MVISIFTALSCFLALDGSGLRAAQSASRFTSVVVDVENVRGKTGFRLSHREVLRTLLVWKRYMPSELTLVIDHGNEACTFKGDVYSVVFAGPGCKADDTIASQIVPELAESTESVAVVTADHELIQRCREVDRRLEIISPDKLVSDLKKILEADPSLQERDECVDDGKSGLVTQDELQLGADLLGIEAKLSKRMPKKERKELRTKASEIWNKLETSDLLHRLVGFLKAGEHEPSFRDLSRSERRFLLSKEPNRRRRETTMDRLVLAEDLRTELQQSNTHF